MPAPITDLTPLGSFSESTPSASVSSTQDASAPLITSEIGDGRTFFTLRAQPSLSGTAWDLSGLDSITINDETVTTSDAFANWSHSLTLALGSHACTLNATDLASPTPNHLTWNFTLERLADEDGDALPGFWEDAHGLSDLSALGDDGTLGDRDLDGMSNLLEFAFNQSPISPGASPCRCETLINPEDGQSYFQLRYPRRIDSIDLRYRVTASLDASLDASSWTSTALPMTERSIQPNPDGVTETVTVWIGPLDSSLQRGFARIEVDVLP